MPVPSFDDYRSDAGAIRRAEFEAAVAEAKALDRYRSAAELARRKSDTAVLKTMGVGCAVLIAGLAGLLLLLRLIIAGVGPVN